MYYLIKFGGVWLARYGEFWERWTIHETEAYRFWDKEEAEVMSRSVGGDLVERKAVS